MEQLQPDESHEEEGIVEYTARTMGVSLERAVDIVRIHHPNAYIGDDRETDSQPEEGVNNGEDF